MRKSRFRSQCEKGISWLTFLVFGTIMAAALYSGYNILPFYYYYFELVNQFESAIRVASTEPDSKIREKLNYHIKKMQLPVELEQLKIMREGRKMSIELKYEEVFSVTWQEKEYEIYTFPFHAFAEGEF